MTDRKSSPRRRYDNETRRKKRAELTRRIAAATAELHATLGPADTSYADIARQAGVSLPTVYSHFPNEEELFQGCTSHVAERAPSLPVDDILKAPDLSAAIERLVLEMEKQHRHYEPWLAWRMDGYVGFLVEMSAQIRRQQTELISTILNRFPGSGTDKATTAGCETLLSFDSWHRLVRGHGLSFRAARQVMTRGILCLAESTNQSAKTTSHRSKNK
ncbi:MAG: TetR/AcrR family transcriptional regulator [Gammaproteobacteria bacterium]|jgi:AcrR family transcriptional regulator